MAVYMFKESWSQISLLQLSFRNLPAWYKSALFNELYFVSDGGTVWLDPMEGNSQVFTHPLVKEYSKFAYLEGKKCDWLMVCWWSMQCCRVWLPVRVCNTVECDWRFADGVCNAVECDWWFADWVCNAVECDWRFADGVCSAVECDCQ